MAEARSNGVTIYTRSGPVDATREGDLVAYVRGYAAALERDKIRQRTLDGKRMTAKQGALPVGTGAGLYGYDYAPRIRGEHKRQQARTINQSEAETVRRMFGMALEGLGAHRIATILNQEGIRGKTGSPWHPWTVKNTLRNPAYIGVTRYGTLSTKLMERGRRELHKRDTSEVITIDGFTPPIVDAATFERAQVHLNRPRQSGRAHEPYMLSGMLRCAACGTTIGGQKMSGRWRYYTCRGVGATATRPRICDARRNRTEVMDNRVWTAISNAVGDPTYLFQRVMAHQASGSVAPKGDEAKAAKARIRELATAEKNLLAALRAAPSAAQGITAELEIVAQERQQLEGTLGSKRTATNATGASVITQDAIKAFSAAVNARLKTMDVGERQQLLSILGFQATVTKTGDVQASILVPAEVNPNHHCTNIGMTTWM